MYGNEIVPIGETGFGVSYVMGYLGMDGAPIPQFMLFHISDGFRQTLGGIQLDPRRDGLLGLINLFPDRCAEVEAYLQEHYRRPS